MKKRILNGHEVELREGRLLVDGTHVFLKTAKPLRDFGNAEECEQLMRDLPILKDKRFTSIALNCYWHHLDPDGDGVPEVSLEPLRSLVDAILEAGLFCCLSVETYGVGGGQIPLGFWERHPEAKAVDHLGQAVIDDEYGYGTAVPSLFDPNYLRLSRAYTRNLACALGPEKFLYFETTVEPQYMGNRWIDYGPNAQHIFQAWCERRGGPAPEWPKGLPVPSSFRNDPVWNQFRAEWLAHWVNGDAAAFRQATGPDAWVACDYLDAEEDTMVKRCGHPETFLQGLSGIDILQVNWTWHYHDRCPNLKAYHRVRKVMEERGREWAVTEHMTINGTDYRQEEMDALLRNTLENGSCFGWEFVDVAADSDSPSVPAGEVLPGSYKPAHFSVYDADWRPIPPMAEVDERWDEWMELVAETSQMAKR